MSPSLLQLAVISLDLLLASLVFLLEDNQVLLEHILRAGKLMIHEFELVQVLLTVDQLAQCCLKVVTFLILTYLFLLLDNGVSFLDLLALVFDFLLVLLILVQDHPLFLLHNFLFLFNNLLYSPLNFLFQLFNLVNFGGLCGFQYLLQAFILVNQLVYVELLFQMLLSQNVNFVLLLLISYFALGNFFNEFLIFVIETSDSLDFGCVFSGHDSQSDPVFIVLISFDH